MRYVLSKLSIEAGRRHRWGGPLFQRRYQAILVSDEGRAQDQRLRYLLAHGVKENLVAKVAEGRPHSAEALVTEAPVRGIWYDRTGEWLARNHGKELEPGAFQEEHELVLTPLPCWRGLLPATRRRHARELIEELEAEAAKERRGRGLAYLGPRAGLDQDPHGCPASSKRSPAPRCHACAKRIRRELQRAYGLFLWALPRRRAKIGGRRSRRLLCRGVLPARDPLLGGTARRAELRLEPIRLSRQLAVRANLVNAAATLLPPRHVHIHLDGGGRNVLETYAAAKPSRTAADRFH